MKSDYMTAPKTRSLNEITIEDMKDPHRKENMERAGYVAQPITGIFGKMFKSIGYVDNTINYGTSIYHVITKNWGALAQNVANLWLPSSILLNSGKLATYESSGRLPGERHPRTRGGSITGGGTFGNSPPSLSEDGCAGQYCDDD